MSGRTKTPVERVRALKQRALAALALAAALLAPPARASSGTPQAQLNVSVAVNGFAVVTDLAAAAGGATGSISLTWTEPGRRGASAPFAYDVRVSTVGQIDTAAQFAAAAPLASFSASAPPAPGAGGGSAGFVVAGLTPGVTHYFAIEEKDSTAPTPIVGPWLRGTPKNWSPVNWAVAQYTPGAPDAITDLVAVASGTAVSPVAHLRWTAPRNVSGVPFRRYVLRLSSVPASSFPDGETWFQQAPSTSVVLSAVQPAGSAEAVDLTGLPVGPTLFFGVKSEDVQTEVSAVDAQTSGLAGQARVNLVAGIDVHAAPGPQSGSVSLTWTEPAASQFTPPLHYVVAVSSAANFDDDAGFDAAAPLSALSGSAPPAPGVGGSTVTFVVTGLEPATTYYFGVREADSSGSETHWVRHFGAPVLSTANFAAAAFEAFPPDAITDLTALAGAAQGQLTLSWTAPRDRNFAPIARYTVKYATFSAASLAGDTTAWFNAAPSSAVVTGQAAGSKVSLSLDGLFPLSTFYFGVESTDAFGDVGPIDTLASGGAQAFSMPGNTAPPAVSSFSATGGFRSAAVSWLDLTAAQKGLAFAGYRLFRSTDPAGSFVQIATTSASFYLDKPLVAYTTVYYKVDATQGAGGLAGVFSSTAAAVPFTLAPQEPFGFVVTPASSTVSFTWTPTVRFADGSPFTSTGTPSADELLGYRILRSTDICAPSYTFLSSATLSVTTFTDVTNGNAYFYQISGYNTFGPSTSTLVMTTLGERHYMLDDCSSEIVVDPQAAYALNKASNTYGGDILISRNRRPTDVSDDVLESVEFHPMLNGVTELKTFYLPKPARVVLHYETSGGAPVGDTRPLGLSAAALKASKPAGKALAGLGAENLGAYWFNGQEFKKVYGTVDPVDQSVTVQSPNLGVYQVRAMLRSDSAVFDLSNVSGRVITPNGDGKNDQIIFTYDPGPRSVTPEGRIYDLHGAFVADMRAGLVPNTLVWDGMMNGRVVTSGVYVYQIKGDGKAFSGTIVVAR